MRDSRSPPDLTEYGGLGRSSSVCTVGLKNAAVNVVVLARGTRDEYRAQRNIIEDPLKKTRSVTSVPVIETLKA